MDMIDTLLVDYKSDKVKFNLSYGYLDKIYEAFNHKTQQKDSIESFVLQLDNEAMPDKQYLLLEDMSTQDNNIYSVELNLDGLEYRGVGKISRFFDRNGLNINLHLLEEN